MDLTKNTLKDHLKKLKELSTPKEGSETEFATVLGTLENDGNDTVVNLGVAKSEATSRKQSVRSLEQSVEELKLAKTELEQKVNADDPNKDELEKLRSFHKTTIGNQRESFGTFIENVREHENFKKASPDLKLPKPGEDGKFNLTEMSQEDLEHNVGEMTRFNRLGIFGEKGNGQTKIVDGSGPEKNIPQSVAEKISGAKTLKELKEVQASL